MHRGPLDGNELEARNDPSPLLVDELADRAVCDVGSEHRAQLAFVLVPRDAAEYRRVFVMDGDDVAQARSAARDRAARRAGFPMASPADPPP